MNVTVLSACRHFIMTGARRSNTVACLLRRFGSWFGGQHLAFGLSVALLAGALSLATWVVWDAHREAEAQAQRTVQNLVKVLEQDIARNIELYDLAFEDVITALQIPGLVSAACILRRSGG